MRTLPWTVAGAPEDGTPPGEGFHVLSGEWSWVREVTAALRQGRESGESLALVADEAHVGGAWRALVQPAIGTVEAGIQAQATEVSGFLVTLGGNPGLGGFALKTADGKVLWEDRYAPWHPYMTYVLEAVVEEGRVRVQMFDWDAKTLVSQGPWVDVDKSSTAGPGRLGLYAKDGIARFQGFEWAEQPLSPIVDDAPNKRRLVQGEDTPWTVIGPGSWMWTTKEMTRLRQYAKIERSSAITRDMTGALQIRECRVRVDQGAGGAGLLFQVNDDLSKGFNAWLGGTFGAGSLMLYRQPMQALWSSPPDSWHYDEDLLIRAQTRADGKARAQLYKADGTTLIQDSGWIEVGVEDATREGKTGFMTWLGTAEFWGFSAETAAGAQQTQGGAAADLGQGWQAVHGTWQWGDDAKTALQQTATADRAAALNRQIEGIMGTWRCRVRIPEGTGAAGLLFQTSGDLKDGFVALLTGRGAALENLAGKVMWEDTKLQWKRGEQYVVEGEVMTDRVAVRVLAEDGKTVLSECPAVYVPDTNNSRTGYLGLTTRGGPAEFAGWGRE